VFAPEPARKKGSKVPVDSTYMDRLGTEAARDSETLIRQKAEQQGISLPMSDAQLDKVLDWTIKELVRMKKMSWQRASLEARGTFINAWVNEMNRLGIRS
jgi:hypothetical protein